MIKMNFSDDMKVSKTVHIESLSEETKSKGWMLKAAIVILVVGVIAYFVMGNSEPETVVIAKPVVKPAPKDLKSPEPSANDVQANGQVASGSNVDANTLPAKVEVPKVVLGPAVPLSVIDANESLERFVTGLLRNAPVQVGFNEIAFQSPNYYYMRGLAVDKVQLKKLEETVSKVSNSIEKSIVKPVGVAGVAQEFTIYGELLKRDAKNSEPLTVTQKKRAISDTEGLLKKMISEDVSLSKKSDDKLARSLKEIYTVSGKMTFQQFNNFINNMAKKKIPVHVEIVQLSVGDEEDMSVNLTLSLYSEIESKN